MKYDRILHTSLMIWMTLFSVQNIKAQKIDTDSLLTVITNNMKNAHPDYKLNIQRALLGKKTAPDYLDFYLALGRNYDLTNAKDSARYYYNYVIEKNPKYQEAFIYLINLNIDEKKYDEGITVANKAIELYPDEKVYRLKRIAFYSLQNDTENEAKYLKSIKAKFPNDPEIQQLLYELYSQINMDRVGVYYNYTTISRDGIGPWHLGSVDYLRQRSWGSLIGKVSYAKRLSANSVMTSGLQFEAESYLFAKRNNYSYIDVAYSQDNAFPKLRLGYSYFHNFNKGWEADLGVRYILMNDDSDVKTLNIGLGKYFGSYWVNLRSYIQSEGTSLTLTSRYYYKTKFDYITLIAGYGTSPDDKTRSADYESRLSLKSYRLSAGFFKLIKSHYIAGFMITDNEQEYTANKFQTELDFAFLLQYKF
ncbi:outer membrane protein, YaiO family [Flavobacterium resistens]|uniref:Outer membrane protein, YaiO family n=1 Tax=Flavobacterium resistens TaxID=443612 RepID=A0A521BBH2_9FLAO|nr:YaiO family outer membrane beta-barrel protein [Flavobacterium resistens]MRX67217.1 YaiO family outer membrane beta-barrel protein [Flavobacterium resistens]SMO44435.1 outer membrane protein, YaiO family [Flavobacterium resistens]